MLQQQHRNHLIPKDRSLMQRRQPRRVPLLDVSALVDQCPRYPLVPGVTRDVVEGRVAVARLRRDVRAPVKQQPHRPLPPMLRRDVERRLPVVDLRRNAHPELQEQSHHPVVPLRHSRRHRGLAIVGLGEHIRPVHVQPPHHLLVPLLRRDVKRAEAVACLRPLFRAVFEEEEHHFLVSVQCRGKKRRGSVARLGRHVRAVLQEQQAMLQCPFSAASSSGVKPSLNVAVTSAFLLHHSFVVPHSSRVQRRGSIYILCRHVRSLFEQLPDNRRLSLVGRIKQRVGQAHQRPAIGACVWGHRCPGER
eukprot:CAMPEP_0180140698 /NCGR_PEP_ID=MMETSP0986-20121125/14411_1 /TAXON_ID=697907 /ORGANISM="non described non described, Strain CCMP2293" /LENGTH=304 /DNA_ID=CAMNT_0022083297 /DNA_START=775 /DNA_END=1686 /DNA_ORIENTATION=+